MAKNFSRIQQLTAFLSLFMVTLQLPAQALEWVISTDESVARGIVSDAAGNAYIIGQFMGWVDFDPGPGTMNLNAGATDIDVYLQKLDPNGNLLWVKTVGGSNLDEVYAIEIDSQENLIITGYSQFGLDFSNVGMGAFPNKTGFVWKLDPAGNSQWVKVFSATNGGYCMDIGINDHDDIYVAGHFEGIMDMDPGAGVVNDTLAVRSPFLIKLDAAGSYLGALIFESNSSAEARKLTVDSAGFYFSGVFYGTLDTDPGPMTSFLTSTGSGSNIFFFKIDHNGILKWAKQIDTGTFDDVYDLETDHAGNVYVSTNFEGTIDSDPSPTGTALLTADPSGIDALLIKFDSSGQFLNSGAVNGYGSNVFRAMTVDSAGNIFVSIQMYATHYMDIALGQDTVYEGNSTQSGGLVIKYAPDFTILWIGKHAGNPEADFRGNSIHQVMDGSLLVCGQYTTSMDLNPEDSIQSFTSSPMGNSFAYRLRCTTGHSYSQYALCDSVSVFGQTFTETGLHHFHIPGSQGCDSVITASIQILAPTVWDNGLYLNTAPVVQAQYQWLDCNNNFAPIPAATQAIYQYPGDGSYAVAVTANGCTDTSDCYVINTVSVIHGLSSLQIAQLPEGFRVQVPGAFSTTLIDLQGRVLASAEASDVATLDMGGFPAGVYLMRVRTEAGVASRKVMWMGR